MPTSRKKIVFMRVLRSGCVLENVVKESKFPYCLVNTLNVCECFKNLLFLCYMGHYFKFLVVLMLFEVVA